MCLGRNSKVQIETLKLQDETNGRTHEPTIRELVAEFDGFKDVMNERDRLYMEKFRAQEEKNTMALAGSDKAVTKAETAVEKRLEGVNEFRKSLSDQATMFLSKPEAEPRFSALDKRVSLLEGTTAQNTGRSAGTSASIGLMILLGSVLSAIIFGVLNLIMKK